ncbi:MAG: hypothetical protein IPM02_25865 [Betaproteobacteria bacterium]|nr:hypothetical protein [Betaproteobacteria bacterium]
MRELLRWAPSGDDYRVMAISLGGRALDVTQEAIKCYEAALRALKGGDVRPEPAP